MTNSLAHTLALSLVVIASIILGLGRVLQAQEISEIYIAVIAAITAKHSIGVLATKKTGSNDDA